MANTQLRRALNDAGMQPSELADMLSVDQRTMRRWLAGGTPYARHRTQIARALDLTEAELWPHLRTTPPATTDLAAVGEPLLAYQDNAGADTTRQVLSGAEHQIDLACELSDELLSGFTALLLTKAREGCQIRILTADQDVPVVARLDHPAIAIRVPDVERPIICRVDQIALAWLNLTAAPSGAPVLLQIRADRAPGLFARLADQYEHAWERATPLPKVTDEARAGDHQGHAHPQTGDRPPTPASPAPATPRRHWPGRSA